MFYDYYSVLGITKYASSEEIKKAYWKLAKKYHPDKNVGNKEIEEKFKLISEAYNTLSSPEGKSQYDLRYEYYNSVSEVTTTYHPPQKPHNKSYYTKKKTFYSPFVKMYGKIFVLALVMTVVLVPIGLFYQSSLTSYERGIDAEKSGEYEKAITHYGRSISIWSTKNFEASIRLGMINLHHFSNYKMSEEYFGEALRYVKNDSIVNWVYFKLSQSLYGQKKYEKALSVLNNSQGLNYLSDSVNSMKSKIFAYGFKNYESAKIEYKKLILSNFDLSNSWFGLGWSEHNLENYDSAIVCFDKALKINHEFDQAWLFKGVSYFKKYDTLNCCKSLEKSIQFGNQSAKALFGKICLFQPLESKLDE